MALQNETKRYIDYGELYLQGEEHIEGYPIPQATPSATATKTATSKKTPTKPKGESEQAIKNKKAQATNPNKANKKQ